MPAAPLPSLSTHSSRGSSPLLLAGIVLLLGGAVLPFRALLRQEPHRPVIASTMLAGGTTTVHLPIRIAKRGNYSLSIAVDDQSALPSPDSNAIGCLLGMLQDSGDTTFHCAQFGPPITLAWTLRDAAGQDRGHGHHPPAPGSGTLDDETRKRISGTFAALTLPVGDCTLEITGLRLPQSLLPLHPSIDCIFENEHYDYYRDWTLLFVTLGSGFVALLGFGLVVAGLRNRAGSRRSVFTP